MRREDRENGKRVGRNEDDDRREYKRRKPKGGRRKGREIWKKGDSKATAKIKNAGKRMGMKERNGRKKNLIIRGLKVKQGGMRMGLVEVKR